MNEQRHVQYDAGDLIERVHKLRVILPAMAQETADARREIARLRLKNAQLQRRITELERAASVRRPPEGGQVDARRASTGVR